MSALLTGQDRGGPTPVQREADEAVENPLEPVIDTLMGKGPENPLEPGNKAMEWKNRGEVPHLLHHAHEDAELVEEAAESGSRYAPHSGSFVEANAAFLGPMEMGLGAWSVADGLHKGGSEGYQQALGGAASFTGGAAPPSLRCSAPLRLRRSRSGPPHSVEAWRSPRRGWTNRRTTSGNGRRLRGERRARGREAHAQQDGREGRWRARHVRRKHRHDSGRGVLRGKARRQGLRRQRRRGKHARTQLPGGRAPVIDLPAPREELDEN